MYRFAYDANGNITQIITPKGDMHVLTYTAVNLGANYTPPGNGSYELTYNQDRQPIGVILPGGRTIETDYDSCGRLERKAMRKLASTHLRRRNGRIVEATRTPADGGEAQTLTFTHDGDVVTEIAASGVVEADTAIATTTTYSLRALGWMMGRRPPCPGRRWRNYRPWAVRHQRVKVTRIPEPDHRWSRDD